MKRKSWVSLCLAVLMLFALCGCNQEAETPAQRANFANTVMDGKMFAYRDGFIYFSEWGYMYEYDTQTGKTARLGAIADSFASYVTATEDQILYFYHSFLDGDTVVSYLTRDGKDSGEIFRRNDSMRHAFLDGNTWYFTDSGWLEEQDCCVSWLWSRDATTGEETLLLETEQIIYYFLNEDYIYVLALDTVPDPELDALLEALNHGKADKVLSEEEDLSWEEQKEKERQERQRINNEKIKNDDLYVLRSRKDKIAFERVDITQKPIALFVDGDDLYISTLGDWKVWHCSNGTATELPIRSAVYQVFDGHLVYADQPGSNKSLGDPLKLYNLKTGEIKELAESVCDVAVLADRYIAYSVTLDGANFRWYVYDWQTGETTEMVKPV